MNNDTGIFLGINGSFRFLETGAGTKIFSVHHRKVDGIIATFDLNTEYVNFLRTIELSIQDLDDLFASIILIRSYYQKTKNYA